MRIKYAKSILLAAITSGLFLPLSPAFGASRSGVEEIVVTARKREESILKVPVVETVITTKTLQDQQIRSISDITTLTTGLLAGDQTLDVGTLVSIRGIGTTVFDPGIDQSVSLNVDGLQLSQGTAYQAALFDMSRVEVLKGPQALFYGKSSPGGVIAIRTADPGKTLEVIGSVSHQFIGSEWRGDAIISGPLSDTLGIRIAAMYTHSDSYFRNIAQAQAATGAALPPSDWNSSRTFYLRGTTVFNSPSNNFSARLKVNYTTYLLPRGEPPFQLASCPEGPVPYGALNPFAPGEDCKLNRTLAANVTLPNVFPTAPRDGQPFTDEKQAFGTLELKYNLSSELALTSVTGYYQNLLSGLFNGNTGFAATAFLSGRSFKRREIEEEVRLNSDFSGPVNFTAGGFYEYGKEWDAFVTRGNPVLGLPQYLSNRLHNMHIDSKSLFAQVRYKPVSNLEIAAGARWTDEKRWDDITNLVGTTVVHPVVPVVHSKRWSPEFTLTYTPTDDVTVYGSLKQGYKSGSYSFASVVPGGDNSFGDERVRGGEIGLKARMADQQLFINAAGYYYNYNGLQVGSVVAPPGGGLPQTLTVNAGSARVYGAELEATYRPASLPDLTLRTGINWNHARFTKFNTAPCWGGQTIAEGCNQVRNATSGLYTAQDLSGAPLVRAPDWQINFSGTYDMPISNKMMLTVGMDGQYSSKYVAELGIRPDFYQSAYAKINAHIGLKGPEEGWEMDLIGNNITSEITKNSCSDSNYAGGAVLPGSVTGGPAKGPAGSNELNCIPGRGTELWLRLTVRPVALFGAGS